MNTPASSLFEGTFLIFLGWLLSTATQFVVFFIRRTEESDAITKWCAYFSRAIYDAVPIIAENTYDARSVATTQRKLREVEAAMRQILPELPKGKDPELMKQFLDSMRGIVLFVSKDPDGTGIGTDALALESELRPFLARYGYDLFKDRA